jgi:hypothetical protein
MMPSWVAVLKVAFPGPRPLARTALPAGPPLTAAESSALQAALTC